MMEQSNPQARRVLAAGCVCGLLGSLVLPWDAAACTLYALGSAALAVGCGMLRKVRPEYGSAAKPAAGAAVAFVLGIFLDGGSLAQMPMVAGAALLYFAMAYYTNGAVQEAGVRNTRGGAPRPPKAAVRFEYAAGLFVLALLLGEMMPAILRPAQLVAMAAMGVGFVQMGRFMITGPRREDLEE